MILYYSYVIKNKNKYKQLTGDRNEQCKKVDLSKHRSDDGLMASLFFTKEFLSVGEWRRNTLKARAEKMELLDIFWKNKKRENYS